MAGGCAKGQEALKQYGEISMFHPQQLVRNLFQGWWRKSQLLEAAKSDRDSQHSSLK